MVAFPPASLKLTDYPVKKGNAMFKRVCNLINKLTDILGRLLAILLGYDVIMRYIFNSPTSWVLDITQLIQAAIAFLVAGYVLKIGGHVNMNLLTEFANDKWRRLLSIAAHSLFLIGSGWMSYLSWDLFAKSYRIKEATYSLDLPLYPWKFLVMLCFILMGLQCLVMLIENILASPDEFAKQDGKP
jgi:C4-dicarboxylate transporter DctQ subunit